MDAVEFEEEDCMVVMVTEQPAGPNELQAINKDLLTMFQEM